MDVNIRLCDEQDKEKVAIVLLGSGLAKTQESGVSVFLKELKRGDRYLIAENDGEPVGVVSWILHGEPRHELAELYHIGVVSEGRGKGVAEKLFNALVEDANTLLGKTGNSLRKLYLLTHEDNVRAQKFYERVGMEHETTLKDHFRKELGELVYSKFFRKKSQ